MTDDTYAGLPVRRGLFGCDDWQRMAEDLMAFQDAVQEALGTEEAGHVLGEIARRRDLLAQAAKALHVALYHADRAEVDSFDTAQELMGCAMVLDDVRREFHTEQEIEQAHADREARTAKPTEAEYSDDFIADVAVGLFADWYRAHCNSAASDGEVSRAWSDPEMMAAIREGHGIGATRQSFVNRATAMLRSKTTT